MFPHSKTMNSGFLNPQAMQPKEETYHRRITNNFEEVKSLTMFQLTPKEAFTWLLDQGLDTENSNPCDGSIVQGFLTQNHDNKLLEPSSYTDKGLDIFFRDQAFCIIIYT
ncbi:uncharacterized protein LOC112056158 [Bicyclus anynana]|uniref:Uncharacterized protein LOC112056158 n=1 Tax=Bicyclus anynana TaxID=110368 RepID=A0ABM3LIR7_BICAN|nr:uncharacterized protein LOC112056158 [Bicyclus anynana]